MACGYFLANGSSCANCPSLIKSTAIALSGTTLQITIPSVTMKNHCKLCIALCQAIPGTVTPNTTVSVVSGSATLNLIDCFGNYVYADQLRSRRVLHLVVATDIPLATVTNWSKLCCTQHDFPVLNAPTATTSTASSSVETSVATTPSVTSVNSLSTTK